MGLRKSSATKNRDNLLRDELEEVKRIAQQHRDSRRRFAVYRYLRAVLRCYCRIEKRELLGALRLLLAREHGIPDDRKCHPIRAIIDATATLGDTRMRSRWTRALEFAWHSEASPKQLAEFFQQNDGVAGCARLAAKAFPERNAQSEVSKDYEHDDGDDDADDEDDFEGPVYRYTEEECKRMRRADRRL